MADVNLQPFLFSGPHIAAESFLLISSLKTTAGAAPGLRTTLIRSSIPSRYSCICQLLLAPSPRMQRQHVYGACGYDYFGVDSDEMLTYCFKPVHTFRNDGGGGPVITQRGLIKAERGTTDGRTHS